MIEWIAENISDNAEEKEVILFGLERLKVAVVAYFEKLYWCKVILIAEIVTAIFLVIGKIEEKMTENL